MRPRDIDGNGLVDPSLKRNFPSESYIDFDFDFDVFLVSLSSSSISGPTAQKY